VRGRVHPYAQGASTGSGCVLRLSMSVFMGTGAALAEAGPWTAWRAPIRSCTTSADILSSSSPSAARSMYMPYPVPAEVNSLLVMNLLTNL